MHEVRWNHWRVIQCTAWAYFNDGPTQLTLKHERAHSDDGGGLTLMTGVHPNYRGLLTIGAHSNDRGIHTVNHEIHACIYSCVFVRAI